MRDHLLTDAPQRILRELLQCWHNRGLDEFITQCRYDLGQRLKHGKPHFRGVVAQALENKRQHRVDG